jgi:hypothetical protein
MSPSRHIEIPTPLVLTAKLETVANINVCLDFLRESLKDLGRTLNQEVPDIKPKDVNDPAVEPNLTTKAVSHLEWVQSLFPSRFRAKLAIFYAKRVSMSPAPFTSGKTSEPKLLNQWARSEDAIENIWNVFHQLEPAMSNDPASELVKPTGSLTSPLMIGLNYPTSSTIRYTTQTTSQTPRTQVYIGLLARLARMLTPSSLIDSVDVLTARN